MTQEWVRALLTPCFCMMCGANIINEDKRVRCAAPTCEWHFGVNLCLQCFAAASDANALRMYRKQSELNENTEDGDEEKDDDDDDDVRVEWCRLAFPSPGVEQHSSAIYCRDCAHDVCRNYLAMHASGSGELWFRAAIRRNAPFLYGGIVLLYV